MEVKAKVKHLKIFLFDSLLVCFKVNMIINGTITYCFLLSSLKLNFEEGEGCHFYRDLFILSKLRKRGDPLERMAFMS